jgi:HAE1 family hydrophobic/amphiphilic exporter-1
MFMLSAVVTMLGAISLFRLPVDLLPDVTYPTITVSVGYGGVGPAEIEQLIVRPLEQSLAAVPGLEQINSTAAEGRATVRLNFAWGTNLNEAADEVRTRMDRVRGRLPNESDPPNISKFDAAASPIMGIGLDGDFDRVALREMAETGHRAAPRARGRRGVGHRERRPAPQIHVELSKEKITALDLSVDRVIQTIRTENQNVPLGELMEGDTSYLPAQPGRVQNLEQISDLVIQTKGGVPVYLRDLAVIKDTTEDLRSFTRIDGKPGVQAAGREAVRQEHRWRSPPRFARRSTASTATCARST